MFPVLNQEHKLFSKSNLICAIFTVYIWRANNAEFLGDNEDSDQTASMRKLTLDFDMQKARFLPLRPDSRFLFVEENKRSVDSSFILQRFSHGQCIGLKKFTFESNEHIHSNRVRCMNKMYSESILRKSILDHYGPTGFLYRVTCLHVHAAVWGPKTNTFVTNSRKCYTICIL